MTERRGELLAAGPCPFLKWAGGKGQLLAYFEARFPPSFGTYFEPFLGGGAVFFHLASRKRLTRAVISDLNRDLMNCYVVLRDNIDELLLSLRELQKHARDRDFYYNVARKRFNEIKLCTGLDGNVEKASLLFYLNRTCYNGLYRVNKKGEFNVPWGRYKNPRIYDEQNLRAVHEVLSKDWVEILCADYREALMKAKEGDLIYLDPPYQPISQTANFTGYTAESFTWRDQQELAKVFHELDSSGCLVMLSNSPKVRSLYEGHGYQIEVVKATRAISCIGNRRGPVDELLVLNYGRHRT
jgi:DNA adenine methylase